MRSIYLAKLLETKMRIINVIDLLGLTITSIYGNLDRIIKIILIELDKITQNVIRLFVTRAADEAEVGITAFQGHPVDEICVCADAHDVDFIISGICVRTRLDRVLIGRVANKIIRMDKVPFAAVRGE